jgi:hypothetical protein
METVPRSGSIRMVRPPYSNWYCACAAVLASSKNAAAANVFFIIDLLSKSGAGPRGGASVSVTYITFMT